MEGEKNIIEVSWYYEECPWMFSLYPSNSFIENFIWNFSRMPWVECTQVLVRYDWTLLAHSMVTYQLPIIQYLDNTSLTSTKCSHNLITFLSVNVFILRLYQATSTYFLKDSYKKCFAYTMKWSCEKKTKDVNNIMFYTPSIKNLLMRYYIFTIIPKLFHS